MAYLDAAKDPVQNPEPIGDPFGNPESSQFGVVPNLAVPASPLPIADPDSPAQHGLMKGTAEELHLRNASRRRPLSPESPSGINASPSPSEDEDILGRGAKARGRY